MNTFSGKNILRINTKVVGHNLYFDLKYYEEI